MKIVHVVPNIDLDSGGPSYSVTRLCEGLHNLTPQVRLFTTTTGLPTVQCAAPVQAFPIIGTRKIAFSPKLKAGLKSAGLARADILHSHGLWMLPNIYPAAARQRSACKLLLSPRGMLAPWSLQRSRFKKRVASLLGQSTMLAQVDCFHATAESEYEDIRRLGFRQPISVIPNGVDMPAENSSGSAQKQVLFLSRIHPKKGIETLLSAWNRVQDVASDWQLAICGPGEAEYLSRICQQIEQTQGQVRYVPPVFGQDKSELFYQSSLFVLPTKSENFGIVVAEALAHAVPAIVTQGAPWQGLEFHRCGWWIEDSVEVLEHSLRQAMALPASQRAAMGQAGRQWMQHEFSWDGVADKMLQTYQWLHGQEKLPAFVRID